jgi:2-enoate reductase
VATGASERKLPDPFLQGANVHYAVDALLNGRIEGNNVVIIGGGLTGCEIAYDLSKSGKKVTIVEMTGSIINSLGLSAANYNMLMDLLEHYKVKVIKNAKVVDYDGKTVIVNELVNNTPNVAGRAKMRYMLGAEGMNIRHKIAADSIVVSIGYISEKRLYEQIKNDHVYLIGDAKRPANVMEAIWQAYETAINI